MNLKSSVLLLFLTLTWQVSLCSIKPDSLSKHNIGINFLRITDLEFYSGFSASYSNGINSPTGVYYQYKFASRYSGRIGVHYGSNSYTLENLQVFDGGTTLIQNCISTSTLTWVCNTLLIEMDVFIILDCLTSINVSVTVLH